MKKTKKTKISTKKKWPDPEFIDDENPELTDDFFKNAKPFKEVFPEMYASWKRTRGKQKTPVKEQVTLRLSHEVLDYFRATGRGWQTRLNQVLLDNIRP